LLPILACLRTREASRRCNHAGVLPDTAGIPQRGQADCRRRGAGYYVRKGLPPSWPGEPSGPPLVGVAL